VRRNPIPCQHGDLGGGGKHLENPTAKDERWTLPCPHYPPQPPSESHDCTIGRQGLFKNLLEARHSWLIPVILAALEADQENHGSKLRLGK
jgi:hypothetical protein